MGANVAVSLGLGGSGSAISNVLIDRYLRKWQSLPFGGMAIALRWGLRGGFAVSGRPTWWLNDGNHPCWISNQGDRDPWVSNGSPLNKTRTIPGDQVEDVRISTMTRMAANNGELLTFRQMADLVSYFGSLKGASVAPASQDARAGASD